MGFNPRLAPYTQTILFDTDQAADFTANIFRFPAAGRVLALNFCNDASIATSTNTVLFSIGKSLAGTGAMATMASKAAGTAVGDGVPTAMTLTSAASTMKMAAGDWVCMTYDEVTTGLFTRMAVNVDYIIGYDV